MGDTVNVSARIESHTKIAGQHLLYSESTRVALSEIPADEGEVTAADLKGVDKPMKLFFLRDA